MDEQSPIIQYSYQVYQKRGDKSGSNDNMPITAAIPVRLDVQQVVVDNLQLQVCHCTALLRMPLHADLAQH